MDLSELCTVTIAATLNQHTALVSLSRMNCILSLNVTRLNASKLTSIYISESAESRAMSLEYYLHVE